MQPKFLYFVSLISLALITSGQALPEGTFINFDGMRLKKIIISDSNKFDFLFKDYSGGERGHGVYQIKGKSLLLIFDKAQEVRTPPQPKVIFKKSLGDTTILNFYLYQVENKEPISGAVVRYKPSQVSVNYLGTQTNGSGYAKLTIQKDLLPINVFVGHTGLDDLIVNITQQGVYDVYVPMDFKFIKDLTTGHKLEFYIRGYNDSSLNLLSKSDYWYLTKK